LPFVTFSLLSSTVGSLPKWLKVLGETRSTSLGAGVLVAVVVVVVEVGAVVEVTEIGVWDVVIGVAVVVIGLRDVGGVVVEVKEEVEGSVAGEGRDFRGGRGDGTGEAMLGAGLESSVASLVGVPSRAGDAALGAGLGSSVTLSPGKFPVIATATLETGSGSSSTLPPSRFPITGSATLGTGLGSSQSCAIYSSRLDLQHSGQHSSMSAPQHWKSAGS